MATVPSSVSNQVLVDLLKAELLNATSSVQDLFAEMVKRWSAASTLLLLATASSLPIAQQVGVRLSATGIILEKLDKFTGTPLTLENWLFNVKLFCEVHGIIDGTEMVKLAAMLLSERALIWWRAESINQWATLGILDL